MPPIVLADLVATLTTLTAIATVVVGVADMQFLDGTLYGIEAGAGCSHGLAGTANTLIRVHADASITPVADVSANCADPSRRHPDADSFALDGTWYGSIAVRGAFHVTEPNHQKLDRITPDSTITRVVDLCMRWVSPAIWQGPTGIVYHGNFSVGTLDTFPVHPGTQKLYTITPSGQVAAVAAGVTAVLGVACDRHGTLYTLETDTVAGFPGATAAASGQVVRENDDGSLTTIASGLTFPTALTVGPDGALYVSNVGFGVSVPGAGTSCALRFQWSNRTQLVHSTCSFLSANVRKL